jgi:hypothetical protein
MKRPGDNTPDPPGGRAAERLKQFEDARLTPEERARRERERVGREKTVSPKKSQPGKKKK